MMWEPHRIGLYTATVIITIFAVPSSTLAQRVPWSHPDGTTHWYEVVASPGGITWIEASEAAITEGGYLATLTSEEENNFVFDLIDRGDFWYERPNGQLAGPWIGGHQPPGSPEPGTNWQWVTGEPVLYSNWTAGEPNELNGSGQNRIHFGEDDSIRVNSWDDVNEHSPDIHGYVMEFSSTPRTVGLILNKDGAAEGYTLFAPLSYGTTYLIDIEGRLVRTWDSAYPPGNVAYLLENGNLLRTATLHPWGHPTFHAGGSGGRIEEYTWEGSLAWEFEYSDLQHLAHHDVEKLPNGNVLMIAWEYKSSEEAIEAGRNPDLMFGGELWPDHIIEVEPVGQNGGNIVWEWHVWDHLIQDYDSTKANYGVVADHPERIDINYAPWAGPDWNHFNSIDYNEAFDQIIVSVLTFSEIWVIDHSTTIEEAAGREGGRSGRGGDILYRWGNPEAYDAGVPKERKLFSQHDAQWIEPGLPGDGDMVVFNNGNARPEGVYSTVDEIVPPVSEYGNYELEPGSPFGPEEPVWTYIADNPGDFYSDHISGAQRQSNGNTLICEGSSGTFFEVTSLGDFVWAYVNPVTNDGPVWQGDIILEGKNSVFRAYRYPPDYPGFDGRDLTPGDPIELYPPTGIGTPENGFPRTFVLRQNYPNPFNPQTVISYELPAADHVRLKIYNVLGQRIRTLIDRYQTEGLYSVVWDGRDDRGERVASGVYFYRLQTSDRTEIRKSLLLK